MLASHRAAATLVALLLAAASGCSKAASADSAASGSSSSQSKLDKNLTDLPTYPNLNSAMMMGHPPTQGAVYDATTSDSYDKVVAWYRAHLQGAKEEHSGYYDSTKGDHQIEFHMAKWNEQVMIYANAQKSPGTSITLGQDAHN